MDVWFSFPWSKREYNAARSSKSKAFGICIDELVFCERHVEHPLLPGMCYKMPGWDQLGFQVYRGFRNIMRNT